MANKSFVFRFNDVEAREREFTLIKAGKVLMVEPKAPNGLAQVVARKPHARCHDRYEGIDR
jgi:hypothetical protein